jgi:cysteine desulfurase
MVVYLDNASTTRLHDKVIEAMMPYMSIKYGNPSSLHSLGREAKRALDDARESIKDAINLNANAKVVFTASATEANNLALKGIAYALKGKGKSIIVSSIEHESILEPCKALEHEGFKVTYIPVDSNAIVSIDAIEHALRESRDTILVSVMLANNEVGSIQPLKYIAEIAHRYNALVHTDAAQALGKIALDAKSLCVDLITLSAHKLYGPKGIGALCINSNIPLEPIVHGGGHEYGLRSGTQNIPAVVGFSKVAEMSREFVDVYSSRVKALRDKLERAILESIKYTRLNSTAKDRLPNTTNISFLGINGEDLIIKLDEHGICASTGSACSTLKQKESHVLRAMNLSKDARNGSLRLTLGIYNEEHEIDYTVSVLEKVVNELRKISPILSS